MRFTDRFKLLFKNNFDEYVKNFMTGADLEETRIGVNMDSSTAMKYSAVFACNKILAETFACMPVVLYKKTDNGEREEKSDLPIYDILRNKPNDEMAPFNFKEAMMTSLNLGGNTVCERLLGANGQLVGLYPYKYSNVDITRNKETQKLEYVITNGTAKKTLSRDQVFHVPNLSLDGIVGLSPISYAASAIWLGITYEQFGIGLYTNGANSSGAFSVPNELGEESFNRLKKEIKANYTGLKKTGTPMLLEGGMTYQPFSINPVDAQLLESKSFQIEDVCRIYRVPLHLVQNLAHATFSNIEQQSLEFVIYTMLPIVKRFEENINMQLLTVKERMAGYFVEFNMAGLLRGDIKSRYDAYALGRQWGFLSINDIRKLENMPSIPNGDTYLQPLNMLNIDKADEFYSKNIATKQQSQKNAILEEIVNMLKENK